MDRAECARRRIALIAGLSMACAVLLAAGCGATPAPPRGVPTASRTESPPAGAPVSALLGATHDTLFELLGVDPVDPGAMTLLAQTLSACDLVQFASPLAPSALGDVALSPDDPDALARAAAPMLRERRYGLASLLLDHAVATGRANASVHVRLGDALMAWGRRSLAIEAYDRGIDADPGTAAAWEGLARACFAEGRLRDRSPRSLRAALVKTRELATSDEVRRWAETGAIRLDMVEGTYRGPSWRAAGSEGDPKGIGPLRLRTTSALEKAPFERENARRIELLEEAVREDPGNPTACGQLARELASAERWAEAVPYLEDVRRLAARDLPAMVPEAMALEGECLLRQGRPDEAERLALAAAQAAPQSAYPRCVAGEAAMARGDAEAAESRAREALSLWPEHAPSLLLLSGCLDKRGERAEARRALRYALWASGDAQQRKAIEQRLGGLE